MNTLFLFVLLTVLVLESHTTFASDSVYQCETSQGTVFTNIHKRGWNCEAKKLPALSTVPSVAWSTHSTPKTLGDQSPVSVQVPSDSTHDSQVCALYDTWLTLNLQTRGGLQYHPLSAPLMKLFGGGYIPLDCGRTRP